MIINITKSKLFTLDPDIRFANEYALPHGTWIEVFRRYKLLNYSNGDLRDYVFIKHARNLGFNSMDRWIIRSEIYSIAKPLLRKGVQHVSSDIFGDLESYVMKELTKTLKSGSSGSSRSII